MPTNASSLFFIRYTRYSWPMRFLLSILLLATMLVVIFINPLWLGRGVHFSLILLLFVFGVLYWFVITRVSAKNAATFLGERVLLCRFGATGGTVGGPNRWGSLVATEEQILFLSRKAKEIEIVFRLERDQIRSISLEKEGRKKRLLLIGDEEEHWILAARLSALAALLEAPKRPVRS